MNSRYCLAALALAGLLAGPVVSQAPEAKRRVPIQFATAEGWFIVELNPNLDEPACKRCMKLVATKSFGKSHMLRVTKGGLDEVRVQASTPLKDAGLPPRTKPVKAATGTAFLLDDTVIVTLGPNPGLEKNKRVHILGAIMGEGFLRGLKPNVKTLLQVVQFLAA